MVLVVLELVTASLGEPSEPRRATADLDDLGHPPAERWFTPRARSLLVV